MKWMGSPSTSDLGVKELGMSMILGDALPIRVTVTMHNDPLKVNKAPVSVSVKKIPQSKIEKEEESRTKWRPIVPSRAETFDR